MDIKAVSEVNFFLLFGDFKLRIWSEKLYLELKVVFGCKGCIWSKFKLLFGVFKLRIWSEKLYLELKVVFGVNLKYYLEFSNFVFGYKSSICSAFSTCIKIVTLYYI